ncbi:MAG: flagellar biosynthesis protein FlhA [Paracoccaceae bacterium]|nr:flagellar biosynthesis protein FlhA [Paracoccaceae bacterium]
MKGISGKSLFQPTILLTLALMTVIVMMVLPVPAVLLDIGLAASFALAILIFTTTLFIDRPLDFSSFPTILLSSLMLRLSLNVTSTKLIIGNGQTGRSAAGHVIEGFANFIMGGSVLQGVVIFLVLLIVNFVVITKGAGRMAEVGARFALDAMPGKQLAIDAELASGAIDHAEARARREREQAETTFFGSLDGVSKFVKGDAVAGLLITGLNVVVGLSVGIFVHGLSFGQAFATYAFLTVGDGLVTQIPAVIISIASALLLAKGGAKGTADLAIISQLGRHPSALATVAALMAGFALVPGLPTVPFLMGAAILGGAALVSRRNAEPETTATEDSAEARALKTSLGDILDLDDIHVEFAPDLVPKVVDPATGLDSRIANMRVHVATTYGLILPEIRLTDDVKLPVGTYRIRLQGVEAATGRLFPEQALVLLGEGTQGAPQGTDVLEPVYKAPARWISPDLQEDAALQGLTVVTPIEVLATHLLEVLKDNLSRLLSLRALRRLLDELSALSDTRRSEANKRLFDELIPDKVPIDILLPVLKLLLDERVSIRNLPAIIEAIAEVRGRIATADAICEHVRQRLGFQIVAELKRPDGSIPLLQLAPDWEQAFRLHEIPGDTGIEDVALPPEKFNQLATAIAEKLAQVGRSGIFPALVTSTRRRRFLRTVLRARGLSAPVLSFEEIGIDARPALVGTVLG